MAVASLPTLFFIPCCCSQVCTSPKMICWQNLNWNNWLQSMYVWFLLCRYILLVLQMFVWQLLSNHKDYTHNLSTYHACMWLVSAESWYKQSNSWSYSKHNLKDFFLAGLDDSFDTNVQLLYIVFVSNVRFKFVSNDSFQVLLWLSKV